MSRVASVTSGKGGVGKTTFILNLAGTLSNLNKKTLIVDADLYGGAIALALNKEVKKTIADYQKEFKKGVFPDILNYVTKYNDYIDFLAAPSNIIDAESITIDAIESIINSANLLYDVVLFDTNHIYNKWNDSLHKKMNNIFYIITNDTFDLKNSRNNLDLIKKYNPNIDIILNNSIHISRGYYILYDIKNIIKSNVDYTISNKFHSEIIDTLTIKGEITTIYTQKLYDYKIFTLIAKSLL